MDDIGAALRKKPAFRRLSPQKRRFIEEMSTLMSGKEPIQCIQIFLAYHMRMENEGIRFTPDESALMKECLLEMLPSQDRARVEWMLGK